MGLRAQVRGQHSSADRPSNWFPILFSQCDPRKYYFDDLWYYDTLVNQWRLAAKDRSWHVKRSALEIFGDPPPPRKGHSMIVRPAHLEAIFTPRPAMRRATTRSSCSSVATSRCGGGSKGMSGCGSRAPLGL